MTGRDRISNALKSLRARRARAARAKADAQARTEGHHAAFRRFAEGSVLSAAAEANKLIANDSLLVTAQKPAADSVTSTTTVHLERDTDLEGDATVRFSLEHGAVRARIRIGGRPYTGDYQRTLYLGLNATTDEVLEILADLVVAATERLD